MVRALRALWAALKDMLDEFWILLLGNVAWAFMSLPLLGLAFFSVLANMMWLAVLIGLLSVVLVGPATAGLYSIARRTVEGRTSSLRDFLAGMRTYARASWRLLGLWAIGLIIILFDLGFYGNMRNIFGTVMSALWLYLLAIWCALLIYLFPLLLLQEKPRVRTVVRNAFIMVLGRPLFTLFTLVLMLAVVLLSLFLPFLLVLLTMALLAVWSFRATQALIREWEERRAAAEGASPGDTQAAPEKGRRGQVRPR